MLYLVESWKIIDITVDGGKWYNLKVADNTTSDQALPSVSPIQGWKPFPSRQVRSNFIYGHIYHYQLENVVLIGEDGKVGHRFVFLLCISCTNVYKINMFKKVQFLQLSNCESSYRSRRVQRIISSDQRPASQRISWPNIVIFGSLIQVARIRLCLCGPPTDTGRHLDQRNPRIWTLMYVNFLLCTK